MTVTLIGGPCDGERCTLRDPSATAIVFKNALDLPLGAAEPWAAADLRYERCADGRFVWNKA
jgi:hypothetical protein